MSYTTISEGAEATPALFNDRFTTIHNLVSDVAFNVKDYGATGDGTTDDGAAIRLAIAAATTAGGGKIIFPKPSVRYLVTTRIVGASNVTYEGVGRRPTIRYTYEQLAGDPDWYVADGVSLFYFADGASNVTFRNLKLEYTGTFNPTMSGINSTGKISGIKMGRSDNTTIEDCEITGFNRHGVTSRPIAAGSSPSTNLRVIRSKIHTNRQCGIWYTHDDGVLIDDCDLHDNGLVTDVNTGYGTASSGYESLQYPTNVTVQNCRVYNNTHRGIDLHRGKNVTIQHNRLWAPTATGVSGEQIVHIAIQDVLEGNIKVLNNDIRVLRNRGASYAASTTGIDIRWPAGSEGTNPLRIEVSGNTFSDINCSGVDQASQCILFETNSHKDTDVIISNNQIDADDVGYFVLASTTAVVGTLVKKRWTVTGNQFKSDSLQSRPLQIGNVTEAVITGNEVSVLALGASASVNPIISPIVVSGQTLSGKLVCTGNIATVPTTTDLVDMIGLTYNVQDRANTINGKPLRDRLLGYEGSAIRSVEQYITNTALPQRTVQEGARALVAIPPAATHPGWLCVDVETDTIGTIANAGDTVIAVTSSFLMAIGDQFAILLDNNIYHWSTITAISGNNVTIADAIPASRTSPVGNAVQSQRWEPIGLSKPIATKTTAYTALSTDHTVLCDATAAVFSVTLPRAATCKGHILVVKKIDSSANTVTIDGFGAETIDDAATRALATQYTSAMIHCDGTGWWVI